MFDDIKKIELHLHLDGSLDIDNIAKLENITYQEAKQRLVCPDECNDLNEYLEKFDLPISHMQTKKDLQKAAYDLAISLKKDNVIYAEVRFAPIFHTKYLSLDEVVESVISGFKMSDIKVNLLLCMMRGTDFDTNKSVIDLAYKYLNKGVCGVDLAGAEGLYKTSLYKDLFSYANKLNIPFTIHAGEADGPESVIDAISFGAKRIGHGIRALESNEALALLKEKDILLEVCPTSNYQTKAVKAFENHPILYYYNNGYNVSINTDNRTVSNITLNLEYEKLNKVFGFTKDDFIKINLNTINHCFISEKQKEELRKELLGA